jgi:cell division protease FtsH
MSEMNSTQKPDAPQQRFPLRGLAMWLLLLVLALSLYQMLSQNQEQLEIIPYNPDFVEFVEEGRVRKCEIVREASGMTQYIRGELVDIDQATAAPRQFRVEVIVTPELIARLEKSNVPFKVKSENHYMFQILSGVIPFLLVLGLLYFFFVRQMRAAGRGAMNFGKSRARMLTRDKNKVTFNDVAGIEEGKEEVNEIIEFLSDPKKFQKLGGRIPKGVLLVGPPGTGKTLLAKAIAGEAEVPFFSISGSDFVEMFVGVGASRVRDMFEQGKKSAPCIIFIDEIDAVGRSRFSGIGGGHDEREQTLNALLVEMDGFDTQEGVIIIAATNRPDVLDQALLRPGRFDRQIMIDLPNLNGRLEILNIHAKKVKLSESVELKKVARGTPGFSGADLANLINEAALLAARRNADQIELEDLEESRDKVRWGRQRKGRMLDENEKRLTAYHEAGHAIVMEVVEESEPVHKVTIIPRGQALGATMQLPEKDRYTESRLKLKCMLSSLMGGRAAEEIVFGEVTTGASNDLKQVTNLARAMVCQWGMSESLGPQTFGDSDEPVFVGREMHRHSTISEETARKIDEEVSAMARAAYEEATSILTRHRKALDVMAEELMERETIDGRDVKEIVEHGRVLTEVERAERDGTQTEDQGPSSETVADSSPSSAPQGDVVAPPLTPPKPGPATA